MSKIRDLNLNLNFYERMCQKEILDSFPVDICLPAGDQCNLKCIFCIDRSYSKFDTITFEDFRRFTDHIPLGMAYFVQIQSGGEPLVNPDYENIFNYVLYNNEGRVSFNTNGLLLDKWIDKLTSSNREILVNISLNASSRETYRSLTGKDCFHKVIDNIKLLVENRKGNRKWNRNKNENDDREDNKKGSPIMSPIISLSFIGMRQNIAELPKFVNLAADLCVNYAVLRELMILNKEHEKYTLSDREKTAILLREAFQVAKDRNVTFDTTFFPIDYFLDEYSKPNGECNDPWTSFIVDIRGDVKICCYSDTIVGNIFEQDFSSIWNGDTYRFYRKMVNTSNPPEQCISCVKKR